jgi:hypothetical protein
MRIVPVTQNGAKSRGQRTYELSTTRILTTEETMAMLERGKRVLEGATMAATSLATHGTTGMLQKGSEVPGLARIEEADTVGKQNHLGDVSVHSLGHHSGISEKERRSGVAGHVRDADDAGNNGAHAGKNSDRMQSRSRSVDLGSHTYSDMYYYDSACTICMRLTGRCVSRPFKYVFNAVSGKLTRTYTSVTTNIWYLRMKTLLSEVWEQTGLGDWVLEDAEDAKLLTAAYPDIGRESILNFIGCDETKFIDFVLALIHMHNPGCEPEDIRRRRVEVRHMVEMRMGARVIVKFLRRRAHWRRTWCNPLKFILEEVQRMREEREQLEREAEERERLRMEEEARLEEEAYQAWLREIPHFDMHDWARYAVERAPNVPHQVASYFSRCVYYSIHVPCGRDTGSVLRPSVSDPVLERYGYAPQKSASTFRTVCISMDPPEGQAEEGDETGYTPTVSCVCMCVCVVLHVCMCVCVYVSLWIPLKGKRKREMRRGILPR